MGRNVTGYGVGAAKIKLAPVPVIASRNPLSTDLNYILGQIWTNKVTGSNFILSQIVGGAATWAAVTTSFSTTVANLTITSSLTMSNGVNVVLGTAAGTKIGTATTQKLGFFNATPIVQPASTTDLRTAIINLGLLATGGATPLNLNGGALTAGSATIATTGVVISTAGQGVTLGGGAKLLSGAGAPTAITAPQGSLYLNTTGNSTSTRAYVNSDGGTTWVAVTTAS